MPHILICDDHTLFLEGLVGKLESYDYRCECVSNEEECRKHLQERNFDIFLCDINIAGFSGFELIKNLRAELKNCRIYMLSGFDEDYLVDKAKAMQVDGYLRKDISVQTLVDLLGNTEDDFVYLPKTKINGSKPEVSTKGKTRTFILSRQEKRIIQLIADGLSSKEIGDKLFISKNTVDTHRRNISRKLEVNSPSALIKFARENNLIS